MAFRKNRKAWVLQYGSPWYICTTVARGSRDHVKTLHDEILDAMREARARGTTIETIRKDIPANIAHTFANVHEFREELARIKRKWLAIAAEGSPLDLYVQRNSSD